MTAKAAKTVLLTLFAFICAAAFIMPTVLTIANSFMTSSEITVNYGALLGNMTEEKKTYISDNAELKFIPDMVST